MELIELVSFIGQGIGLLAVVRIAFHMGKIAHLVDSIGETIKDHEKRIRKIEQN